MSTYQSRNNHIIVNHLLDRCFSFGVVCVEERWVSDFTKDEGEFPAEIDGIVATGVETLS